MPKIASILLISIIISTISIISLYNSSSFSRNYYIASSNNSDNILDHDFFRFGTPKREAIKIAVTSCGDNTIMEQTFVMIKSVVMFSKKDLHFIIFVDNYRHEYEDQVWDSFYILLKLRKNIFSKLVSFSSKLTCSYNEQGVTHDNKN